MDLIESLSEEAISRLGDLPLFQVAPNQSLREAIELMQSARTGCVLVCDGNKPTGVLTERDVLRHMGTARPLDVPVSELVTGNVWSVRLTDSVATALRLMNQHQCRHLVVVDDAGEAVGLLPVKCIVSALVEHFPSSVYNLPPVANQVQQNREGA